MFTWKKLLSGLSQPLKTTYPNKKVGPKLYIYAEQMDFFLFYVYFSFFWPWFLHPLGSTCPYTHAQNFLTQYNQIYLNSSSHTTILWWKIADRQMEYRWKGGKTWKFQLPLSFVNHQIVAKLKKFNSTFFLLQLVDAVFNMSLKLWNVKNFPC